jgi:hypothetical protein
MRAATHEELMADPEYAEMTAMLESLPPKAKAALLDLEARRQRSRRTVTAS